MYKPSYETDIRTTTRVEQHSTMHIDCIDWDNYPFDDLSHASGLCGSEKKKREHLEKRKEYLMICEGCKDRKTFASNYGGLPRIWQQVISVGMGSSWPYWSPRPTVVVSGTLGAVWYDWLSLTGAYAEPE